MRTDELKVLGFDGATYTTGYSVFDYDSQELVEYGIFSSNDKNVLVRIEEMDNQLIKILDKYTDIGYIAFESAFSSNGGTVLRVLSWLQGSIIRICNERGLGMITYEPNSWRSVLGFKNKSKNNPYDGTNKEYQKNQAIELANKKYGLNFEKYTEKPKSKHHFDDIADAICIILAYFYEKKGK